MAKVQIRYLLQILVAIVIAALGFFQMFARIDGGLPSNVLVMMIATAAMFIITWALIARFQPYANQSIMACVFMLTALGILMIARIDAESDTLVASRQMIWLCIALVCCDVLFVCMRDYRILRRFSYVSMVVGLALLLSPMVPGLGLSLIHI